MSSVWSHKHNRCRQLIVGGIFQIAISPVVDTGDELEGEAMDDVTTPAV